MIPVMRMATVAHMSPSRPQRRDQETIPVMLDGVAVLVGVERTSTKGPGDDPGHPGASAAAPTRARDLNEGTGK